MANNTKKSKKSKPNTTTNAPKERSMGVLIVWNIAKAMEKNPHLNLREALIETSFKLDNNLASVNLGIKRENPEERYLACAMLAWQQLGHKSVDSLCSFVATHNPPRSASDELMSQLPKQKLVKKKFLETPYNFDRSMTCGSNCRGIDIGTTSSVGHIAKSVNNTQAPESLPPAAVTETSSACLNCVVNACNAGPVVRLPNNSTCVMRMQHTPNPVLTKKPDKAIVQEKPVLELDTTCCMQPSCLDRLQELDAMTQELRMRSAKLAKREAERVELLERAERSWKNVEQGYQRRLKLADDAEIDLLKQVKYSIDERNKHKEQSSQLAVTLRENAEQVEKMREALREQDKLLFDRANKRTQINHELSKVESALTDAHSKAWQLDRELQFKEEQARRKLATMESEMSSARALTIETERALRSQLNTLRNQINNISKQLLEEDERCKQLMSVVEKLGVEKVELVQTLETCKDKCECSLKEAEETLKQKKEEYEDLSAKVATCLCQNPVEISVEAKRTPSLAALCACDPDEIPAECRCTSMPNNLLSTMLSGLFAGLQDEMATIGINMPCPLLKCLDDNHSWETASPVKAAIKTFFTNLLVGELEVAIATSIENHHARWVGATCIDEKENAMAATFEARQWQDKAIERKAQKLATKLAEELFNQRADKITEKAKEILKSGPPACDCGPHEHDESHDGRHDKSHDDSHDDRTKDRHDDRKNNRHNGKHDDRHNDKHDDRHNDKHNDKPDDKYDPAVYSCFVRSNAKLNETPREYKETLHKLKPINPSRLWKQTQQDVTQLKVQIENLKRGATNKGHLRYMDEKIPRALKHTTGSYKINHSLPLKESARATNTEYKKVFYGDRLKSKKHVEFVGSSRKQYQSVGRKSIQSYAVNMCLCEPDQDPKKIISGKSPLCIFNQKSSNGKQHSSNRKVKPLDLSTQEQGFENDAQKRNCKSSTCNCFNKEPSNTSINNLLETLVKWKGDLIKNQNIQEEECLSPEDHFNLESFSPVINRNEGINPTSNKTKESIEKNKESDQINNKCGCKKVGDSVPQENTVINATESEYIGTINLEKSNEGNPQSKTMNYNALKESPHTAYQNNLLATTATQSSGIMLQQGLDQSFQYSNSINKGTKRSSEITNNELIDSKCDYDIKLLGVTLTECETKMSGSKENNDNLNNKQPKYIVNVANEESKDNKIDQKDGDTPYVADEKEKESGCTCCQIPPDSETLTEDLEINTFSLLEELLKKRLDKYKNECVSKCFTQEEETEMVTGMIKNIKKTISNSTKCKCLSENENDNFQRGYCLLQEYLKLKLKRVQCAYPDEKQQNFQLSDIYEKICSQIENDFQRLKNVCKCNRADINFEVPEKDTNSQKEILLENLCGLTACKSINCVSKEIKQTLEKCSEIVQVPSVRSKPQETCSCSNTCSYRDSSGSAKSGSSLCYCKETIVENEETVRKITNAFDTQIKSKGNVEIESNITTEKSEDLEHSKDSLSSQSALKKYTENEIKALSASYLQPKLLEQNKSNSKNNVGPLPTVTETSNDKLHKQSKTNELIVVSSATQPTHIDKTISETKSISDPQSTQLDTNSFKMHKRESSSGKAGIQVVCTTEVISGGIENIHYEKNINLTGFQTIDNTLHKRNSKDKDCMKCISANKVYKVKSKGSKSFLESSSVQSINTSNTGSANNPYIGYSTKPCNCNKNEYKDNTAKELSSFCSCQEPCDCYKSNSNNNMEGKDANLKILNENISKPVPYLTYTLSCSCNRKCNCSNSVPKESNNIVNSIWASHLSSQRTVLTKTPQSLPIDTDVFKEQNKLISEPAPKTPRSYKGYTMDCSREVYGGSCSCYQRLSPKLNDLVQHMWANSVNEKSQSTKFAYIMEKTKKDESELKMGDSRTNNDKFYLSSKIIEEDIESERRKFQEAEMNTQYDNDIVLKISENTISPTHPMKCNNVPYKHCYEYCINKSCKTVDENINTESGQYQAKAIGINSDPCDCGMVPVCHVKMLMQSIEDKLGQCRCTCDALNCSVCPIHAPKK